MQHIIDALHRAAEDATHAATKELRSSAANDGWSKDATKAVKVSYSEGEFVAKLTGKHRDAAFVHEFGDQDTPPKATIRKASRNTPAAEKALLSSLETHLKGVL